MLRLFLSLYLLICTGLIAINLSSSFIFAKLESNIENDKFQDIQTLIQLSSGYATLTEQQGLTPEQLSQLIGQKVEFVGRHSIAFLPEQTAALSQGQTVSVFNNDNSLSLYSLFNQDQLLVIGPILLSKAQPPQLKNTLIVFSYLLLALLILFWSKPLWRDLTTLISMTKQVSAKHTKLTGEIPKHSVLSPLHQALVQMSERINELMAVQQQMIHAVSHDIRTPLARMKFALAMLNSDGNDRNSDTKHSLLSDIADIESLIDNLLSFGRIESEALVLQQQDVELAGLLANLTEKLTPLSEATLHFQAEHQVNYYCDGHLLERAVQNLIANGQKYGKSQVNISLNVQQEQLLICIEDDGLGIPQDKIEQALQPFNRLEQSRNKSSGGFGLGLAIVNRIVQWHQGQLLIANSSELGGAKITIALPMSS